MNVRVSQPTRSNLPVPPDFSLVRGGLLYSLGTRLGLVGDDRGLARMAVAIAVFTWVPLVLLSTLDGAMGRESTITFWKSIGTHVRLLLTIPLFFFAEEAFDGRAADALRRMFKIGLIQPADEQRFAGAVRQAVRLQDSRWIEAGIFALTLLLLWFGFRQDLPPGVTTWRTGADGRPTLAGWWYAIFCLPIFQFLVWRWSWRLIVWTQLLWRLSRLNLQLIPTHPDAAGGLAVLGVAHVDLAPLASGACAVLASTYAEQILFAGVRPASFAVPLTAAVVGTAVALVLPLTFFTRRLIDTKQEALLEYGTLAAEYTRAFAAKWLPADGHHDEPFLGTADLQSLADLGGSYDLIRNMTVVPIARSQIMLLAGAAGLPFVPVVLLAFPLDQLIINSVKSVLSVS